MESSGPARVLVVAHKTAATPALLDAVRERAARGTAQFTLLVPNAAHGLHVVVDAEDQDSNEAEQVLELAIPLLEEAAGAPVEGMVGDPSPMNAIQDAINIHGFDEVIISTLPTTVSKWLKLDLPSKVVGPRPAGHHGDGASRAAGLADARIRPPSRSRSAARVGRERELVPRDLVGREGPDLGRLGRRPRRPVQRRLEDDDQRARVRARVDADERADVGLDAQLLAELARDRRLAPSRPGRRTRRASTTARARDRSPRRASQMRPSASRAMRAADRLGVEEGRVAAALAVQRAREARPSRSPRSAGRSRRPRARG